MKTLVAVAVIAVGLAAGCGGEDGRTGSPTVRPTKDPSAAPYRRSAIVTCLERRGASVGPVPTTDPTLQELHDLAQRTSVEVRMGDARVALGFAKNIAGAELLAELLTVPNDPYRVVRRGNVVVVYRPRDSALSAAAAGCLRP